MKNPEMITIEFSKPLMQIVLAGLAELPYKVARPAVEEIEKQVSQQLAEEEGAPHE